MGAISPLIALLASEEVEIIKLSLKTLLAVSGSAPLITLIHDRDSLMESVAKLAKDGLG